MSGGYAASGGRRLAREADGFIGEEPGSPGGGCNGKVCCPKHQAERHCTDTGCLLFLLAFLCGMGYVYSVARSEGDLAKLTHGFNWKGEICGVDKAVRDRPLLFWCTPGKEEADTLSLLDGVCVERCPANGSTQNWCPGGARPFQYGAPGAGHGVREVVIGMVRNITQRPDYPSSEAFGYCFPRRDLALMRSIIDRTHVSTAIKQLFLAGSGAMESWRFLVGIAVVCTIIGYAFLFVLWSFFDKLIYGLVVAAHLLLLSSACVLVYVGFHEEHNFFRNYCSSSTARWSAWLCSATVFLVWLLYALLCCYSKGAVTVTIDSVKATCEVIGHLPTMLLQPLVHSAVVVSVLLVLLYGFAWVLSTGRVVPQDEPVVEGGIEIAGVHRILEFSAWQWAWVLYWVFGLVWILETVNALGQFAISHAVVVFACFNSVELLPMLHGYFNGVVFHLGTLAFGGFIIGCLKVVAAVLSFLARQTRDEHGVQTALVRAMCCCCAYCFACIEQVLTMVNDLVYTDVALQGTGYIEAAENVVQIAASNPATYAAIKGSATAVRVLGVTTIGGTGTFISYQVLSSTELHRQLDNVFQDASSMLQTSSILGTTVAAGFVCFYIAMAFMMVFYQTTYTLMYCMLIGAVKIGDGELDVTRRRSPFAKDDEL